MQTEEGEENAAWKRRPGAGLYQHSSHTIYAVNAILNVTGDIF